MKLIYPNCSDFYNGWPEGFLQEVIDTCSGGDGSLEPSTCPSFTVNEHPELCQKLGNSPDTGDNENVTFS